MQKLLAGLRQFMTSMHTEERATFFGELASGQRPEVLFVTCSDSRVVPSLFTQTEPGDLFMIRNVGNVIPPAQNTESAEAAAIEFAVRGLKVKDIVVCGHSDCGAMKGLVEPEGLTTMPAVSSWLRHAAETRRILDERYGDAAGPERLQRAIEINVMVQLASLAAHPAVAERLAEQSLRLFGWVYDIGSGSVTSFDSESGEFTAAAAKVDAPEITATDLNAIVS